MQVLVATALLFGLSGVLKADDAPPAPAPPRYTFSWPLESGAPSPRGGTTKGVPVLVDLQPSAAWQALATPGLSAYERDRRAILAMAGMYRVTFDFLEVANYKPDAKRDRPYQSWGTERVYIDRDDGKFISLVHMLDMRIVQKDGTVSAPIVTKHWRQDWQYEPDRIVEYRGNEQWRGRRVPPAERRGRWSQTVEQVDESPRYASIGRWDHSRSFSTWVSGDTWRPLPRREWTARKDYQVLEGTNRVTVTPLGWSQEENNLKTVLNAARQPDAELPYVAREYGVARYERLRDADFAAADQYYEKTKQFWDEVHGRWTDLLRRREVVTLRAQVDQAGLFERLFAYADGIARGEPPTDPAATVIDQSFRDMGAI